MPAGRPTKYDPRYCDEVIEFMGQGYSLTAFGGNILVAKSTLNLWMEEHPEFSEAVRVGQARRTQFLEQGLLETDSGARVSARTLALKNSAPDEWREKQHVEHSGSIASELKDDELNKAIKAGLAGLTAEERAELLGAGEG